MCSKAGEILVDESLLLCVEIDNHEKKKAYPRG
jgi:hypothetical protein